MRRHQRRLGGGYQPEGPMPDTLNPPQGGSGVVAAPSERLRPPIVTHHRLEFRDREGRIRRILRPSNAITVSGRARLAQLAFAASNRTFNRVALSDNEDAVTESLTGIGPELVTKVILDITVQSTFVELVSNITEAELSVFSSLAPIRRVGVRTSDGQFLFIVPIPDTVPPAGNSLTYVAQLEF